MRLTRRGERVVIALALTAGAALGFLSGPYAWVATR
jgi:hypothetical protein